MDKTKVFYIAVGVACSIIFIIALAVAAIHVHSMPNPNKDGTRLVVFDPTVEHEPNLDPRLSLLFQGERAWDQGWYGPCVADAQLKYIGHNISGHMLEEYFGPLKCISSYPPPSMHTL